MQRAVKCRTAPGGEQVRRAPLPLPIDGPPRTLPLDGVVVRECRAVAVVPTVAWQPQPRGTKEKLAEGAIGRGSGRVGLGGGGVGGGVDKRWKAAVDGGGAGADGTGRVASRHKGQIHCGRTPATHPPCDAAPAITGSCRVGWGRTGAAGMACQRFSRYISHSRAGAFSRGCRGQRG